MAGSCPPSENMLRKPVARKTASVMAGLERARNPMPASVKKALTQGGLMERYRERPAYQQNAYVGGSRAKLEDTRISACARCCRSSARAPTT